MQDKPNKIETHILSSFEEVRDASLEVAAMAERSLTIMTPDLESSLYGSEDFLDTGHILTGTPKIYSELAKLFGPDIKTMFAEE